MPKTLDPILLVAHTTIVVPVVVFTALLLTSDAAAKRPAPLFSGLVGSASVVERLLGTASASASYAAQAVSFWGSALPAGFGWSAAMAVVWTSAHVADRAVLVVHITLATCLPVSTIWQLWRYSPPLLTAQLALAYAIAAATVVARVVHRDEVTARAALAAQVTVILVDRLVVALCAARQNRPVAGVGGALPNFVRLK